LRVPTQTIFSAGGCFRVVGRVPGKSWRGWFQRFRGAVPEFLVGLQGNFVQRSDVGSVVEIRCSLLGATLSYHLCCDTTWVYFFLAPVQVQENQGKQSRQLKA